MKMEIIFQILSSLRCFAAPPKRAVKITPSLFFLYNISYKKSRPIVSPKSCTGLNKFINKFNNRTAGVEKGE